MKYFGLFLLSVIVMVECNHLFFGTNVNRPMVYHKNAEYSSKVFRKRVENVYVSVPSLYNGTPRPIQGVMAYDLTHSGASANVTQGGLGYNYINIRMKSDRGEKLNYDIYIYA
ncbi:uncharacterized protein [Choristoneura fumiferana]|uniref:uncharacterized protein n=1 Tax=Choristoneura fumiferana TaxID=7141 RepID=UPI003D1548DC